MLCQKSYGIICQMHSQLPGILRKTKNSCWMSAIWCTRVNIKNWQWDWHNDVSMPGQAQTFRTQAVESTQGILRLRKPERSLCWRKPYWTTDNWGAGLGCIAWWERITISSTLMCWQWLACYADLQLDIQWGARVWVRDVGLGWAGIASLGLGVGSGETWLAIWTGAVGCQNPFFRCLVSADYCSPHKPAPGLPQNLGNLFSISLETWSRSDGRWFAWCAGFVLLWR